MVKLLVIGNLGKDATSNVVGQSNVINFSVAHTEKFVDNNGAQQQKTTWFDCAYWAKSPGILPYLTKGTQVYLEGTVELGLFQKQDGSQGASLRMKVFQIQLLGSPQQQQQQQQQQAPAQNGYQQTTQQQQAPQQGWGQAPPSAPPQQQQTTPANGNPWGNQDLPF